MAWNEPGGNKPNDPWNNDQGPPDLDEAFRRFREKLFGGLGGGGDGGPGGARMNMSIAGLVLALLFLWWVYSGVYVIDEQERGVVMRFGKFTDIIEPGFNWRPAIIDTVVVVNTTGERQYRTDGMMLTRDENIVRIPMTVQYNVADVEAFVLKVRDPEFSLREATDSALRHVVGSSTLNNTLGEGRQQIADEVKLRLQNYLDNYGTGIQIIEINIQEAQPPAEVADAFDDVVKAVEDEQRAKELAQAYANSIIPEARGRAQRMLEEAEAYKARVVAEAEGQARRFTDLLAEYEKAPEVTRERLYLDAVQQVMQNTSKVMVTSEGGNNILYLPLDQMANRSSTAQSDRAINMTDLVQRAADEVAARQERGVSRDTRRTREGR